VVTAAVSRRAITRTVHTFGKVAVSEPTVHRVNVKFNGWVERLFVDREGDRVFRGQPLFEVYSPDLVAAQREFLVAYRAGTDMTGLLEAARARLANWDISKDQIEELKSSGEVTRTLIVRAPADGVVTRKLISEGDRVTPDRDLYEIVDLSSVWVVAQVYEQDLPFVHEGQLAEISFSNLGGKRYDGTVSYVAPFLNSRGQVEIRLDVDNFDNQLKPEMYAEVSLISELAGHRLVIPRAAVINSGTRQIAYTTRGDGKYQPREITTGAIGDNDLIEVRTGLDDSDQVVVSGQFLLDSESRLSEALADGIQIGHNHSSHSQKQESEASSEHTDHETAEPTGTGHDREPSGVYTCPMPSHYNVLQYGEGKCDKCGMKLVPIEDTDNREVYICPMPEDQVVQNKPGRCPKCNMKLRKLDPGEPEEETGETKESMEAPHSMEGHNHSHDSAAGDDSSPDEPVAIGGHDVYTCPMPSHFHVLQYGEGKCTECGMKLVPLAETDNKQVYVCPMSECQTVQNHKGSCPVCGMNLVKYQPEQDNDK